MDVKEIQMRADIELRKSVASTSWNNVASDIDIEKNDQEEDGGKGELPTKKMDAIHPMDTVRLPVRESESSDLGKDEYSYSRIIESTHQYFEITPLSDFQGFLQTIIRDKWFPLLKNLLSDVHERIRVEAVHTLSNLSRSGTRV